MNTHRLTYISENIFTLREQDRIIGCYLYDEFDDALSRIEALVVESGTLVARYAVVTLGGMLNIKGKALLLPIEICQSVDLGKVRTAWRKESLMHAPTPHNPEQVTMAEEELILGYFDLKPYWAVEPEQPEEESGNKNSDPESRKE
jgi:hypothetical protein